MTTHPVPPAFTFILPPNIPHFGTRYESSPAELNRIEFIFFIIEHPPWARESDKNFKM
jgi:hypothetical protein